MNLDKLIPFWMKNMPTVPPSYSSISHNVYESYKSYTEVLIDGIWYTYHERKASVEGESPTPTICSPTKHLGTGNFPTKVNGIEQTLDENREPYDYWVKQAG